MQKELHEDKRLEQLRSGILNAEEALRINDELEQAANTIETGSVSSSMLARLKNIREANPQLSHFEELCYKELEGELSPEERGELEDACQTFSHYAQIRTSILQTRLVVPTNITFPHKNRLKHRESIGFVHQVWRAVAVAACLFLFVVLGGNLFDHQAHVPIVAELPKPVLPESVTEQTVTAPPRVTELAQVSTNIITSQTRPQSTVPQIAQLSYVRAVTPNKNNEIEPLILTPRATVKVTLMSSSNDELLVASKPIDPLAFHDWESIMFEEEIAQFETEMQELQENLPDADRPFAIKFFDFVITQLAQR